MSIDWIARLGLAAHPEGGWFRRVYTAAQHLETAAGPRAAVSSIQYLLNRASPQGRLHRNRSVILHVLQSGGPVDYFLLDADGRLETVTLGYGDGQLTFLAVPGGVWKASRLHAEADHALVAEAVVPGFDWADHEYLTLARLQAGFPQHAAALAGLVSAGEARHSLVTDGTS